MDMDMDQFKIIEEKLKKDKYSEWLGLEHTELSKHHAIITVKVREEFENALGTINGGLIFSLMDHAAGAAGFTDGSYTTLVSSHVNFLRASVNPERLIAEAKPLKIGRTLLVFEVTVKDDASTLLSSSTMTLYRLKDIDLQSE